MATPKVFVSSTCYDLKEVRDTLYEFLISLGYLPVFSDKNDVFYHPDFHTHEACIKEIENCQLFVLIIGGRFGGAYKYDKSKSIVNAEYDAARQLNLPIFTFVQKEVSSNQLLYSKNVKRKISYPAIADQSYARNIFEFIISIRRSDENNGLFEFEFARDIKAILKKQFAGLFYDFLWNRKKDKESEKMRTILYDLSSISKKTEEIIENIYKNVDKSPETLLNKLNLEDMARKFWYFVSQLFHVSFITAPAERKQELASIEPSDTWVDCLLKGKSPFEVYEENNIKFIRHKNTALEFVYGWTAKDEELYSANMTKMRVELLVKYFEAYKQLSYEQRLAIFDKMGI